MKPEQKRKVVLSHNGLFAGRYLRLLGALLLGAVPLTLVAAPPLNPLDPPLYSFDAASPAVLDGTLGANDILALAFPNPVVNVPGAALGLQDAGDDLNALSADSTNLDQATTFVLLFSVDRTSVGTARPDDTLLGLRIPYNMLDQAQRGQASGDQYMTLDLYNREGQVARTRGGTRATSNNSLDRNQYDEGGTDFSAKPEVSAGENVARALQDNVNATATFPPLDGTRGVPLAVFLTADGQSPSLELLPGVPSGANIYLNEDPATPDSQTRLFVEFSQLGLVQGDDIDAMIIIDDVPDGAPFDPLVDQVLFSLTPDSPSLATIEGASPAGAAADIFTTVAGAQPAVFALALDLGLGDASDNVDALDFLPCIDAQLCAQERSIRAEAPIPAVSAWGLASMLLLALAIGTIVFRRTRASC